MRSKKLYNQNLLCVHNTKECFLIHFIQLTGIFNWCVVLGECYVAVDLIYLHSELSKLSHNINHFENMESV